MLKIGEFSKLAHVTVKTLHHYEQVGLFKPAWIDRYTGYRYYSARQLPRINRILALKDLGFSLEQVLTLLDRELDAVRLREMMAQKQAELAQHIQAEQSRLEQVALRLQQIEMEGKAALPEVVLKPAPAMWVAALRSTMPPAEMPARREVLRRHLFDWTRAQMLRCTGDWMTLWLSPEYRETSVELDVAVIIDDRSTGQSRPSASPAGPGMPVLRRLPAIEALACAASPAQPAELSQTYSAIYAWMDTHGYRAASPMRELYLADEGSEACPMVEVQIPLEPVLSTKTRTVIAKKETLMEYTLIEKPALTVVGMLYEGGNPNNEIGATWMRFNQRSAEIKNALEEAAYGVCVTRPDLPQGAFEYLCGFAVSKLEDVPAGMVVRNLPATRYAVFKHVGPLESLRATYNAIYQQAMPKSGLEINGMFDMEVYTDEFKDFAPDSVFYIYVPVK